MSKEAAHVLDKIYSRLNTKMLTLKQLGKITVQMAVAENNGNKTAAAQMLGINRRTLVNKMRERCHHCGEICCRCWMLVLVVFLLGCKTYEKTESHQVFRTQLPPAPPRVFQEIKEEGSTAEASAFIGPIEPPRVRLEWQKGETNPDTVTEIWAVNIYTGEKTFVAETLGTTIELWADQPAQFFIARNRLYDVVSEWNIKQ